MRQEQRRWPQELLSQDLGATLQQAYPTLHEVGHVGAYIKSSAAQGQLNSTPADAAVIQITLKDKCKSIVHMIE